MHSRVIIQKLNLEVLEFLEVRKAGEIRNESQVFGLGFGCKVVSFTEIGSKRERRVVFIYNQNICC